MSVIFEGVDGTGKTTETAKFMLVNPNYCYIHNWAKPKNKVDIQSEITKEYLLLTNANSNIVFDRSFIITEYVYATVLKRETIITKNDIHYFATILNALGHSVKVFVFNDIKHLHFKSEDVNLPFRELNDLYIKLFTKELSINNLIVEVIDNRSMYGTN